MGYRHDMSGEKKARALFPEGWRELKITDCIFTVSKSGNDMFVFTVQDVQAQEETELYAIAVKGKRWFLKDILNACGVAAGQDGVYEWDIKDVIGKTVSGKVEHFEDTWIDREGKTRQTTKHKIERIEKCSEVPLESLDDHSDKAI